MRSCGLDHALTTVCHLSGCAMILSPPVSGIELLFCVRYVVQPHSSVGAVTMYNPLQLAA